MIKACFYGYFSHLWEVAVLICNVEKETQTDNDIGIEISYEYASEKLPIDLYNYLAWLLTDNEEFGNDGRVILDRTNQEKVLKISQDIMAHATIRCQSMLEFPYMS